MKQQQSQLAHKKQGKINPKSFDLNNLHLTVKYQPVIYNNQTHLEATISLTPNKDLVNTPLEIQLRGYSHMQFLNQQTSKTYGKSIEVTDDYLNETDEQLQVNVLMGKSKKFQQEVAQNIKASNNDSTEQQKRQGEYFLQGCNVLYQLDEKTGERLQALLEGKTYRYPLKFTLPSKLPISIQHIVLSNIHITIKYTIEIKVIAVDKSFGKKQYRTLIVPFEIQQSIKQYPYQQLVTKELIRLYHDAGRRKDEATNQLFARFIDCLCPKSIYDRYLQSNSQYKTKFKNYDLFHLELVAVVNTNQHMFLVVRSYRQPEVESLTINRDKSDKDKKPGLKQLKGIGEVPNDLSLVSIKNTQRKHTGLGIYKVEVQMMAQIVDISSQSIFKKIIALNQSTYDMLQGQAIVNLSEYMGFCHSCDNQLFVLRYTFNIKPFFGVGEQEGEVIQADTESQHYVVKSNKQQLVL